MDILVKLTVPNFVYQFYSQASVYVAGGSPEEIMADALSAYAGLLSQDVAKRLETTRKETEAASHPGP